MWEKIVVVVRGLILTDGREHGNRIGKADMVFVGIGLSGCHLLATFAPAARILPRGQVSVV